MNRVELPPADRILRFFFHHAIFFFLSQAIVRCAMCFCFATLCFCHAFNVMYFVAHPSNCHIILCDVRGGFHWHDTRAAAPAAASRLLSYCQNPGAPRPQPTGRGTNTVDNENH